jgi:hypothetical protein
VISVQGKNQPAAASTMNTAQYSSGCDNQAWTKIDSWFKNK